MDHFRTSKEPFWGPTYASLNNWTWKDTKALGWLVEASPVVPRWNYGMRLAAVMAMRIIAASPCISRNALTQSGPILG